MAQYPKTTGALVTVNIRNANKAGGDGRMKLDAQLIEMFDIMLPVAELKTMMSDEVDAWIAKMAEYGQEWCTPDGRLLKCSDYPELFALIGYHYGWSNTNPNGTSTYSFTDNNGASKSLVIYNDLDIDGNALPVSGTPAYFRIPNLAGRFLRCAGEATYINKWTDTDGTVRQLLTEYKAEMYRGQLDAQRGIRGYVGAAGAYIFQNQAGCFKNNNMYGAAGASSPVSGQGSGGFYDDNSLVAPTCKENRVLSQQVIALIRIAWGISGSVGTVINFGMDKLFYPKKKEEPWKISASGGLGVIIPALDISRAVPTSNDPAPVEISVYAILRIAWGINGSPSPILSGWSPTKPFWHKTEQWPYFIAITEDINGYKVNKGYYDTSTKVPLAQEIASINQPMLCLLRIAWAGPS